MKNLLLSVIILGLSLPSLALQDISQEYAQIPSPITTGFDRSKPISTDQSSVTIDINLTLIIVNKEEVKDKLIIINNENYVQ